MVGTSIPFRVDLKMIEKYGTYLLAIMLPETHGKRVQDIGLRHGTTHKAVFGMPIRANSRTIKHLK